MSNSSTLVSSLSGPTPTPSPEIRLPSLAVSLGPVLIGGLLEIALWGMICVQTFTYFLERPRDRVAFRAMIAALWLLDTFSSILLFHVLYYYLVINFMNPFAIDTIVWSDAVHMFTVAFSDFVIRALFMYKIYRLSKKIWIIIPLFVLSLLALGSGIRAFAACFTIGTQLNDVKKFARWTYLYFASEAASDVSVAATLSVLLYRGRTGLHKTDGVVRTLMIYIIYTGALAAFVSVLATIIFATLPNRISQAIFLCLGKLYLAAYLAMLNAREGLRDQMSKPETMHPSQLQFPQQDSTTENSIPRKSREEDNLAI